MAFSDDFVGTAGQFLEDRDGWEMPTGSGGALFLRSSGVLRPRSSSFGTHVYRCPDQGSLDQYIIVRLSSIAGNTTTAAVALRFQDAGNHIGWYLAGTGSSGLRLCKRVAGVLTDLSTFSFAVDQWVKVEVVGDSLSAYLGGTDESPGDWTAVASVEDTPGFTSTRQGLLADQLGPDYRYFEAGALGAVSTEPFLLRHNPRTNKVVPVLSSPTVTDIGATCVRPRVTKGF